MKFACESCRAQYMISDEKVGPRGVKVRCKKCGHSNVVRRVVEAAPLPLGTETRQPLSGGNLEDELGAAFDSVVAGAPAAGANTPGPAAEFASSEETERTRIVELPEMQRAFDAQPETQPAPAVEWYVAIGDQQKGPLALEEVQAAWQRAEIGPDTLCWRTGLADWVALSQIPEMAGLLAPRPAPAAASAEAAPWVAAALEPKAEAPAWRPTAASALASLVEQELEAAKQPGAPQPEATLERDLPPAAESTGIRSLLRELPEPPAPEPSRFIPMASAPKAASAAPASAERPVAAARPAAASVAPAQAPKRGGALVAAIAAGVLVVAGGGLFASGIFNRATRAAEPRAPAPVAAAAPAPAPTPAPAPAPAVAPKPEAEPAPAAAEPQAQPEAVAAAAPAAEPAATPAEAAPAAAAEAEAHAAAAPASASTAHALAATPTSTARKASAEPARSSSQNKGRTETAAARREEPAPAPAPTGGGDLLAAGNTNAIDDLFEQEFADKKKPKRFANKVGGSYIPPAPGAGGSKPKQLGQGDILAVVRNHSDELKGCAKSYRASSRLSSGSVKMRWSIKPNGSTTGIQPLDGSQHKELATCFTRLVRSWKFPSYDGPQMPPIDFPFQF